MRIWPSDSSFGGDLSALLLDSLLPPTDLPAPTPQRTEDPATRAGTYELTRYSHTTIERLPQFFNNSIIVDSKGDSLVVYAGGRGERYLQVGDGLYQAVEGEDRLAFDTRDGISYLFRASDVYGAQLPAAYERRRV